MVVTISVLYVDDESLLLEVGKSYLERTNEFRVTTAPSAHAALNMLKSNGIEAIVSDYKMPGMDGIEFLKEIRIADKTIPFILFTGKGREEIAIEAFENGADGYIQKAGAPKPQFPELTHKIMAVVGHRRAEAQVIAANRLYTVISATNKAIVRIHDRKELLDEICRIVVDTGGFKMAWAGLANPKTHTIDPVAAYGHVDGYLDEITISTEDIPTARGPTGTAFRTRGFNVCNDIEHDPKMTPWRKQALERGYRSLAAFPFAPGTKNAGVITLYASEAGFFTDQIIRLLDEQATDITFAFITFDHEKQRIAAEKDLAYSELRYRRFFETARDGLLILDGETGTVIEVNTFILNMLGFPLEHIIGKHLWELGFIKDKSLAQQAFTELQTNGYIRYEDLPLETRDGRSMDVEFISNVYLVGDRKIIQCNIRDITNRKVAHDALEVSETRYRRLFETAQDAILILDGNSGEVIDANRFIQDLLGYPLEYFVGKHLWELGFIKDKNQAQQAFAELTKNEYIRYEDLPLEARDGRNMAVEFVSNVYLVGDKKIIQCNIRDITDRKLAGEALRQSNEYLHKLIDNANAPIVVWDPQFRITWFNHAFEHLTGLKETEVIQKPFDTLFPNDRRERAQLLLRKTLMGEKWENIEIPILTKGGSIRTVLWNSANIVEPDNRIISTIAQGVDITERKLAEDALRLANRKLNLLSGITRHDIRNQILALSGFLDMSKEYLDDPASMAEYIAKEEKCTETIAHQILFSKDYEDLGVKSPVWLSINAIMSEVSTLLPVADIRVDTGDPGLEVFADPLLEKVFYNLIDNALLYGGEKMTAIRVTTRKENETMIIVVEDNGNGISDEDKTQLFTKGFGNHTGLGLFLSREILSITGISISETGIPGQGARFEIAVPDGAFRFGARETKK